jgi:hypothetical protein
VLVRQVHYHLSALLALGILGVGSHIFAKVSLNLDPPIYASCIAGDDRCTPQCPATG